MRKLLIYSLLVTGLFTLPACGDNDDDDTQKIEPTSPTVIGNWNVVRLQRSEFLVQTGQTLPDKDKDETQSPGDHLMKFASNNFHEKAGADSTSGTYTVNGSKLTLNAASPLYFKTGQYDIDSLTASRLIIRDTIPSSTPGTMLVQRTTLIR